MPAFPIDLRLAGRRALVVGGGSIAHRRVEALLHCSAEVTVVAPEVVESIAAHARAGRVAWHPRSFQTDDCQGMNVAIAAEMDEVLGRRVYDDARRHHVLVTVTDTPELCDFYFGALARRGFVAVGVFTDGQAPGMARRLRDEFTGLLDRHEEERHAHFAELRRRLQDLDPKRELASERAAFLENYLTDAALDALREPGGIERAVQRYRTGDVASPSKNQGCVFIVGAGPGDPELLTVRAARLIAEADDLVVDALVDPRIYRDAPGRVVYVGKRAGGVRVDQREIERILLELVRDGRRVVRLKGGDPALFARTSEEVEALAREGFSYDLVPGVSSALAVPQAVGTTLTARGVADRVTLVSGHRRSDAPDAVPTLPAYDPEQTVVVMMGRSTLSALCEQALAAGYPPGLPAVMVSHATRPEERTLATELGRLAADAQAADLPAPATLVLGQVARPILERLAYGGDTVAVL